MDYRIFNMRTLCMRIHRGVGHTNSELAQLFGLGTVSQHNILDWGGKTPIFLVLLTTFEPLVTDIIDWVQLCTN